MNFKPDIFRAYGTLDLVVEIPVRHMNVTALPAIQRVGQVRPLNPVGMIHVVAPDFNPRAWIDCKQLN